MGSYSIEEIIIPEESSPDRDFSHELPEVDCLEEVTSKRNLPHHWPVETMKLDKKDPEPLEKRVEGIDVKEEPLPNYGNATGIPVKEKKCIGVEIIDTKEEPIVFYEEGLDDPQNKLYKRFLKLSSQKVRRYRRPGLENQQNSADQTGSISCRLEKTRGDESLQGIPSFNLQVFSDNRDIRIFKCDQCPYTATRKYTLQQHLRIHSGIRPFKCDHCPFSATQKTHLQQHVRRHSGDKPFQCHMCPFTAVLKCALRLHIRTHISDRLFQCSMCRYASLSKFNLKQHARIHSGEKPFKCNICPYTASQKNTLQKHIKVHLRQRSFKEEELPGANFQSELSPGT